MIAHFRSQNGTARIALLVCPALALLFGLLSFSAVLTKSPTFDENLHVVGGFMHRYFHDYRVNPEDPALFGWWSTLPHGPSALSIDVESSAYQKTFDDVANQWNFVFTTLYHTPANDTITYTNRSRLQFVLLGMTLCMLIAAWAWRLAGAVAAMTAAALFALDPNFLAHAAIVKNDVPLALLLTAFAMTVHSIGRQVKWWNILLIGLICGAAINTKFSGILFGPMLIALLLVRASLAQAWNVFGKEIFRTIHRAAAVAGVLISAALITLIFTWAVYGFRFAATADGRTLPTPLWVQMARINTVLADFNSQGTPHRRPTIEYVEMQPIGAIPGLLLSLESHRVLPQPWLFGFLYTYATTIVRSTFLMGETSIIGWWYYFPLAMLFKTPIATLAAISIAACSIAARFASPKLRIWRRTHEVPTNTRRGHELWPFACVIIPPVIYLAAAMSSNLNLGIRHVLPVYPFLFIMIGVVAQVATTIISRRAFLLSISLLFIALACETLGRWPNYIAFFNVASGGPRGGIGLLADSNLDWGQDLPLLSRWQQTHRDRPLAVSYFGMADPAYFHVDARSLIGSPKFLEQAELSDLKEPCYVAVSATNLMGIYLGPKPFLALRNKTPIAVLGGTIYIFEWKPDKQAHDR